MLVALLSGYTQAQAPELRAQPEVRLAQQRLPAAAMKRIGFINVRSADLRDVLRTLAAETGLNLVVDESIEREVTVSFEDIEVIEALRFLVEEYGLSLIQTGSVFRIRQPEPLPPPAPAPLDIVVDAGLLSVNLSEAAVRGVAQRLTEVSPANVVVTDGTSGVVSGYLEEVPFEIGLRTLLESNGFVLRAQDGVYIIEPGFEAPTEEGAPRRRSGLRIELDPDGQYALNLVEADVAQAVRELARQAPIGVVAYSLPVGARVTATAAGLSLEEALRVVLRGTATSFRYEDGLLMIGNADQDGIVATRLLPLGYVRVQDVAERIPPSLQQGAVIQVVAEQNALLVTGTNNQIAAVESFLKELDFPAPQILIEAFVVDFLDTDVSELGVTFGRGLLLGTDSTDTRLPTGYVLDSVGSGGLDAVGDGDDANTIIDRAADFIGLRNIGRLPVDFYYRIRALETEGKVEVRSRPQISTLNGNTASISIGTTQYFILRSTTPIGVGADNVITQESERFERIEANVSLVITPYVSPNGEITAEIKPEFSQPIGQFTPGEPPTISTRVIESTVRLRDGETIILGGLIEERDIITDSKVPILGDIPFLGRLFRSRSRSRRRSELVIYLTPHVFYGDGRDAARWQSVSDRFELTDPDEAGLVPPDGTPPPSWSRPRQ